MARLFGPGRVSDDISRHRFLSLTHGWSPTHHRRVYHGRSATWSHPDHAVSVRLFYVGHLDSWSDRRDVLVRHPVHGVGTDRIHGIDTGRRAIRGAVDLSAAPC